MVRAFTPVFLLIPLLSGCIVGTVAKTAVDVVSLPVKAVSKGVDLATTSQSEADEKRGRALRKADERRALEERCRLGQGLRGDSCTQPAVAH